MLEPTDCVDRHTRHTKQCATEFALFWFKSQWQIRDLDLIAKQFSFSALRGALPRQQRLREGKADRILRPLASIDDQNRKMIVLSANTVCR